MDYIYDIVLNFQDEYYDFYEWHPNDKIINVKRVPIYKISNKDYLCIKNNEVTIDKSNIPKQNKIILLTSGIEVMAILMDSTGKVIKKSGLLFEESDDILQDKDEIRELNIKYEINKRNNNNIMSRISKEKSKYLNKYFKNINKSKDEYLLKYIYYDIYQAEEKDLDIIFNKLIELSKKDISKLFESVKKVNLELKR